MRCDDTIIRANMDGSEEDRFLIACAAGIGFDETNLTQSNFHRRNRQGKPGGRETTSTRLRDGG